MIAVVHPTGNANVRALLRALQQSKQDYRLFTTIACSNGAVTARCLPRKLRLEFIRRDFGIPATKIQTQPFREMVRLLAKRLKWKRLTSHESGWACLDAVCRSLDELVAGRLRADSRQRFKTVHAYEDCALESFRAAHEQGVFCSYELPIAYWETSRRLLLEEAERYPDWKPTMIGTYNSEAKLERKAQELELADLVVCPSRFVWDSLPAHMRLKRCLVAPFGSPKRNTPAPMRRPNRVFRVLFVGSMTQRKGLADLFTAMRLLKRNDIELVVMGTLLRPVDFYRERCENFTYVPPRAHSEALDLMESCDVLVLPSIVEGRALVQQEALSCGLPIIVTPNAGGEDLIDEGRTGFLVPIRRPDKIAERINWLADHRAHLLEMRDCARLKAELTTWSQYAEAILDAWQKGEPGLEDGELAFSNVAA